MAARAGNDVLRVLAWPGYAEPEVVAEFERRHGCRVEVSEIDSDATLWQRVRERNGADFDVFAVNTAELQRYLRANLALPLNPTMLPLLSRQEDRFRDLSALPGIARNGQRWAVPFAWAEMGLIHDRRRCPEPPDSIHALWDPRWRGQVLAYNGGTHNFSLAAQALGWPDPFQIADSQWLPAVNKLIALRRNVSGFYTQPEEAVRLFRQRQAAIMFANYGTQQLHLLRAAGVDAGYVIPREGALAWLDCWVMARGARNTALAHAWINHLLDQPASDLLRQRQGLNNTTTTTGGGVSPQGGGRLIWLAPVESEDRRSRLWSRIFSGDNATKVLGT